jgi:hypothetical protein
MMHRSNLPIQNMKTLCKHVHILRKCSINARAPGGTESMRVVQGSTVAAVPILILLSRTVLPMPHTMVSGKKESAAQSSNESCVSQESAVPPPPPGPPLGWNESAADDLQDATHVPYTRCQITKKLVRWPRARPRVPEPPERTDGSLVGSIRSWVVLW